MTQDFKSQGSKIIFLSAILVALCVFFFRSSISLFPSFIHAWTQSDRYALALGFLANGFDFFHPRTFNLLTIDGITRVDFPVHEYLVAVIMKLTGIHEPVVFRMYILVYAITGLIFLFRLSQLFHNSFYRSLFVVLFLFLCPVYLYYADGFLPSIPSLSNLFIGYFFYFRYKKEKSIRWFRVAIVFLTLAAIARLPFFIFLFAVFCQQALVYYRDNKIIREEVWLFLISFTLFGAYQLYNYWLGEKYGTQFLISLLPANNFQQLKDWARESWMRWRFEYFTKAHYMILGVLFILFLIHLLRKKIASQQLKDLFIQLAAAGTGSVIYFFLMQKQFRHHDYYFIDAFYPVAVLLILSLLSFSFRSSVLNYSSALILGGLLCLSFIEAKDVQEERYKTGYWDRVEISRQNFSGTEQFLDSIGISKDAKILVLDGYTTNVPFILMKRQGWTVNWTTRERIREGMSKPYDIVAIQNAFIASDVVRNDSALVTSLQKIADNGFISFYRRNENINRTFDQFFGIDTARVLVTIMKSDSIAVNAGDEYTELLFDSASRYAAGQPVKILVSGKILRQTRAPQLTASVSNEAGTSYYFSFDLNDYTSAGGGWQHLLFQFVVPAGKNQDGILKLYLWNQHKDQFYLEDFRVVLYR